jgi:type II secretory ATPase GspE/PulE/Tfp pilus assembly ATPase PilB-like protein
MGDSAVNCWLHLLAQVPETTVYVHPVKLAAIAAALTLWALLAQWVDKDTVAVNTFRVLWNLIVLGSGVAGALLALLVPVFWIGYLVLVLILLTVLVVYVVHRNGLVKADDRVLTLGHLRRLREQGFSGRKKVKEVTERVRLTAFNRRVIPVPTDEVEREPYRLTQDLLFSALWRRAGVVEVAPAGPQTTKITYTVDGVAAEGETIERPAGEALVQYIKQLAGLNLEERRKPQKGEIMAAIGQNKHKVMVRTDGSTAGEKLTLRVIYKEAEYKAPDLGFNAKQLELVQGTKEITKGLILLSAPPRHGLTTTVYSFTRNHDRFLQNIQLMEYEKELDIDNVTQHVFNAAEGKTFAERLLKIVRSDPDIIVVPEVREREAAAIAAKAAAEKQKVYVAVVANDVVEALRKWIAAVGDRGLVAKSLLAVSNQRLLRVLCGTCKQAYKPDAQLMRKLNLPEDKVLYRPPEAQFDKRGQPVICPSCQGTGYVGRTAVFDWLVVDDGLREVIRRSTSSVEIQNYVLKKGGLGLQAQALQKVLDGVTSIQEVARAIRGEGAGAGATPAPQPKPKPQPRPSGPRPAAEGR